MTFVVLGCGYTGRVVAHRLLKRGADVIVTARNVTNLDDLAKLGATVVPFELGTPLDFVPEGALVLYSIPDAIEDLALRAARVVHISTTGVYGTAKVVDHRTEADPVSPREVERLRQERIVRSGPWTCLTLRSAAIYGPGRGIHVSLQRGELRWSQESHNYVSRIHVEDLATHAEAGMLSDVTGTYPVADEEPCTSREMAEFCSRVTGLPLPEPVSDADLPQTRRSDRRVDGSAIRQLLGVTLRYPSYRTGIPASLETI